MKEFLGTPDEYGWEVKRKLVWLGTRSYLFRHAFQGFAGEQDADPSDIGIIDDFICQHFTEWSGLGALDILADVLDLPSDRRAEVLSWSERHNAVFEVRSGDRRGLELRNLIGGGTYHVRMDLERNPFPKGSYVLGSLVPWGGEWYWSGQQKTFESLSAEEIDGLKEGYRRLPTIYYRYNPDDMAKARAMVREQYEEFVARHGTDWVVYPDGLVMAADWQKAAKEKFEAMPPAERKALLERHGLTEYAPSFGLPPDLLEAEDGIGVYFNPEEGQEIMEGFDDVLSGLAKRGEGLDEGELAAIRGLVWSDSISPGFVRRLAEQHGEESILAAFLMAGHREGYALDYLLRRYKGLFYRTRYPTLTIAE